MVTKTAKTGVAKVMVDPSPMHVPENYTQSHQNTSHEAVDGDLVKLTEMVNACLGSKLVEPLTVVDMTAVLLMQQVNNMLVDITRASTLAALNRICEIAQLADDTVDAQIQG